MTNPTTLLDQLKARRAEVASRQTIDLPVPGYSEALWIRYRAIPLEQLNETLLKVSAAGSEKHVLEANADLIIRACAAILVRQDGEGDLEPLDPAATEPTTFSTGTLDDLLGIETTTAREAVFALFSPDGAQPLALGQHSDAIVNFLQGNSDEADSELASF